MPRQKRVDEAGVISHVINRGNARQAIFLKHEDYAAFLRVLSEGLEKYPVIVFSFPCPRPTRAISEARWVPPTFALRRG